jgi:hypothetical protein
MKKKKTFGVSPKGALILREREKERRANLPRVEVIRDGALKRVEENPLLKLIAEFPMLPPINIDLVVNPDVSAALDAALVEVRGGITRRKLPGAVPFSGCSFITQPMDASYIDKVLKLESEVLIAPMRDDPTWGLTLVNPPRGVTVNERFMIEPCTSTDPELVMQYREMESTRISDWLKTWYPEGGEMPFVIKPESEVPDRKKYKLRRANARIGIGPDDNNYRDFHDTIRSWYSNDAPPIERRIYTAETKICNSLERLTTYFRDFKERSGGTRLSGLDIAVGFEADDMFKLMVTEVFMERQPMLLLEVVTTIPNMRSLGFVRSFKEPGTLKARNDSERDISWSFNTFFSDYDVFGRDQLDQFLDIVVYCLDKGVREDISYYG